MITFMDPKEKTKENCLDSQMWHACAGGMVQIPSVHSKVFYFPQGHAEHSSSAVDFSTCLRIPSYIPCNVSYVKFMADPDTDEVYAKIGLIPVGGREIGEWEGDDGDVREVEGVDKPASFAKTLTQSDANNGGGFSVPRYCAETIFPKLDYTADPPVQAIHAMDVHGEIWKFRHIYRGTPRRHLLTTGWSTFVNHKKLVAGDSIVFLRSENGDICVGIRRAKRGIGAELPSGWNSSGSRHVGPYVGFSPNCHEDERRLLGSSGGNSVICPSSGNMVMGRWGRVSSESVLEAALSAGNGLPFEVVYYPRASTPEFCVKAGLVKEALQIRWCSTMRFKMAFETEDSSRISWFMGTISSVQVVDPMRWPDSPWRLLQVTWDEPDLLQNVKGVSPWLVEMVSNMPPIHLSPFSPPRKKPRLPFTQSFTLDSRLPLLPSFTNTIIGSSVPNNNLLSNKSPAGMQGARHNQSGLTLSEHQFQELQPSTLFPSGFPAFLSSGAPDRTAVHSKTETVSCLLTMAVPTHTPEKTCGGKTAGFFLFGQPILTEQQMSLSPDTVSHVCTGNSSSEGNPDKVTNVSDASGSSPLQQDKSSFEAYQSFKSCCLETEPDMDTTRHCSEFVRSARAMKILMDSGRDGVRM